MGILNGDPPPPIDSAYESSRRAFTHHFAQLNDLTQLSLRITGENTLLLDAAGHGAEWILRVMKKQKGDLKGYSIVEPV